MWTMYKSELYFLIVCILIIILRSVRRDKDASKRMFIRSVLFGFIISLISLIETLLPYDCPDLIHYVIYNLYYLCWVLLPYTYLLSVLDNIYYRPIYKEKNFRTTLLLPALAVLVLGALSPFYGLLFKLNLFSDPIPGRFAVVIRCIIIFYYALIFGFSAYRFFFYSKIEDKRFAAFPLAAAPILAVLQVSSTFSRNGYFIVCFVLYCSILYINMHEDKVFLDPLTGLNNRNRFKKYISSILSSSSNKANMFLTYIDIDEFKKINDNYGHLTGDLALRTVSEALLDVCSGEHQTFIARIGGDEFVIISCHQTDESLNAMLGRLTDLLEAKSKKNLSNIVVGFSVGTTSLNIPNITATDAVKLADRNMYIDKQAKKAAAPNSKEEVIN